MGFGVEGHPLYHGCGSQASFNDKIQLLVFLYQMRENGLMKVLLRAAPTLSPPLLVSILSHTSLVPSWTVFSQS